MLVRWCVGALMASCAFLLLQVSILLLHFPLTLHSLILHPSDIPLSAHEFSTITHDRFDRQLSE